MLIKCLDIYVALMANLWTTHPPQFYTPFLYLSWQPKFLKPKMILFLHPKLYIF